VIRSENSPSLRCCTQESLSFHRVLSVVLLVVHVASNIVRLVDQSSDISLPVLFQPRELNGRRTGASVVGGFRDFGGTFLQARV
jgi:hypothetical protein